MIHLPPLIRDLAVILATAGIVTLIFKRIRQPVVLGYLVAGMIVGPHTPPFPLVNDLPNIQTWAELGVIFLMFSLGLEFTFRKLARIGRPALITAVVGVGGMFGFGYATGKGLGWNYHDSLFLGGIISISSTTIILKAFEAASLKNRGFAQLVMGVLIVEDLFAILMIVAFTTLMGSGSFSGGELMFAGLKLTMIVGSWIIVGYFFIPVFFHRMAEHFDDETLTVFAVGLCLMLVFLSVHFGYSPALGAFIMGSILAESRASQRIEVLVRPLRDLFAAVFFVSVGMLMDLKSMHAHAGPIAVITLVVVMGNIIVITAGALLAGQSIRRSIQVGLSLAQIGEFSFILAALGVALKSTSDFLYPTAVSVCVVTSFTSPYLIRWSGPIARWVEAHLPKRIIAQHQKYMTSVTQIAQLSDARLSFRKGILRFLMNAILVSALFLSVAEYGRPQAEAVIANRDLLNILTWLASIFVSAPFIWGMFMAFRTRAESKTEAGDPLLIFIGNLGTIALVGVLSDRILTTKISLLLTVVWAGMAFFLFYRRLENSYRWFERKFLSNLSGEAESSGNVHALAPWDLQLSRLKVPANSRLAGLTLKNAQVRRQFGLNVVIIQRGSQVITPPSPDDRLFPGDELLLLATEDKVDDFQRALDEASQPVKTARNLSDYALKRLVITDDSPLLGKTLASAQIRAQLKGLVVGLERGTERSTNPPPETELKVDDCLWILGETP